MNCPEIRKEGILEEVISLYKRYSNTDFTLVVVSACGQEHQLFKEGEIASIANYYRKSLVFF